MNTLDKESEILKRYRLVSLSNIKIIGNFFSCLKVLFLTHSNLFKKSWIDSSNKNKLPPDFYNDKHHIMMEMMRIDDCKNTLNGKHVPNAFEKENKTYKKYFGENYKKENESVTGIFVPFADDPKKYNYEEYLNNFIRVVLNHSNKIAKYKTNYPKCKKTIFFISDESNEYFETFSFDDKVKIEKGISYIKGRYHIPYLDNNFIDTIKRCKCDYIIWWLQYKNINLVPEILVIDTKHIKIKGIAYNTKFIAKIKEGINNGTIYSYNRN